MIKWILWGLFAQVVLFIMKYADCAIDNLPNRNQDKQDLNFLMSQCASWPNTLTPVI